MTARFNRTHGIAGWIMIGTSLNQYQITSPLGVGGMGEVLRARDTRLNRDVPVKVLLNSRPREQTLRHRPTGA